MAEERKDKVQVHNLCKNFGDLEVLKDISFNIKKGEFLCIVGPTGCGKTTFLNLLTKLIEPTSGEILIDGKPADPHEHNLAFVFQEPSAIPWLTAEDNIKYGLKIKKYPAKYIEEQANKIIDLLGLEKYRKTYKNHKSKGILTLLLFFKRFFKVFDQFIYKFMSMSLCCPFSLLDIVVAL